MAAPSERLIRQRTAPGPLGPRRCHQQQDHSLAAQTKQAVDVNGSSDTTRGAVSRLLLRWAWLLDDLANKATLITGRLAARAVWRDLRRRGEA